MYQVLVCIVIGFRLQSYDIYLNVVSATYGKFANKSEAETVMNQRIVKKHMLNPMENYRQGYGKEGLSVGHGDRNADPGLGQVPVPMTH